MLGSTFFMSRLRLPAVAAGAVAAALLLWYAVLWANVTSNEVARSDFTSTYVGATLLREGRGPALYAAAAQAQVQMSATAPLSVPNLAFVNPPGAAVIALPVTLLPLSAAYRVWQALQLGLLLVAVVLVARAAPWPERLRGTGVVPGAAAVGLAGVGTLSLGLLGQWDGLSALGMAGAYVLWRRNALFSGGLVLTLTAAVAKPHLAIGLGALLLGWRDRRILVGAALGVLIAGAVAVLAVGPVGLGTFVGALSDDAARWPLASMLGFTGLTGSWLGNGAAATALAGAFSLGALVVCVRLGARLRADRTALDLCLAGAAVLSLLASPHMLSQDLALLAPVLVWVLAGAAAADGTARWPGVGSRVALLSWVVLTAAAGADLGSGAAAPPGRLVPVVLLVLAALLLSKPSPRRLAVRPRPAS